MSKEVILSREEVRLELERINYEKAVRNLKVVGTATATMGVVKVGSIVVPKAITVLKGSTMFMGQIAVPHYFLALGGVLLAVELITAAKRDKDKARDKAIKTGKVGELLTLDEGDTDD